jgi:cytochrome c oxidase assembly factor CtaG
MEILIVLIVWGLLGWLIHTMAEKRNRNGMAWAILSIIIFPIGGIILLLLLGTPKAKEVTND